MAETRLQRFRRRRREYRKKGGSLRLRALLKAKAALGRWDKRYCAYHDVSPNVNRGCRKFIMRGFVRGMVPTSTLRFPVGAGSYHNARNVYGRGKAVDLGRRSHVSPAAAQRRQARFQRSEFRAWSRGKRANMLELIGPDNYHTVLNGRHAPLPEGAALENQHDNHVHGAYA